MDKQLITALTALEGLRKHWWSGAQAQQFMDLVVDAIWQSALEHVDPQQIRPFLSGFEHRVQVGGRALQQAWDKRR